MRTLFHYLSKPVRGLLTSFISIYLIGCAGTPPVQSYIYAETAMKAAKKYGAEGSAPGLYFKAQQAYKEGEKLYQGRYYGEAKAAFERAQEFAESAEKTARLKKFSSGEVFP